MDAYSVADMRVRPTFLRCLFVVAVFALLFGAAEAHAASVAPAAAAVTDHQGVEIGATHEYANDAGITNASRLRRFESLDVVLGALVVLALWLSWPCAKRVFRARPPVARFSIRRRGPPALLAAA